MLTLCRGGHLSMQGPWESLVVAGMTVALQSCPETETGSAEPWGCSCRHLELFRRPQGPSAPFPCTL